MEDRLSAATLQQDIRADGRAALVINTRARSGARFARRVIEMFAALGVRVDAFCVRNPDYLRRIVGRAIDAGHRYIVVGGGDGTISSICGLFAYRDIVLGVLPLGTGNSFARTLGYPADVPRRYRCAGQWQGGGD